ncbi:hypothetical protein TCON_0816 [Astathelohania contejeani]|uniref:Uncharacterized protein n=1 Tax=Astathelohania contejeani TaxID=164912 RepID=A0ABQ7I0V7_9MICR|nr:hypothetical protein TCON_0816 [Thelohania contejeani]
MNMLCTLLFYRKCPRLYKTVFITFILLACIIVSFAYYLNKAILVSLDLKSYENGILLGLDIRNNSIFDVVASKVELSTLEGDKIRTKEKFVAYIIKSGSDSMEYLEFNFIDDYITPFRGNIDIEYGVGIFKYHANAKIK